jgi:hypothetical protein
VKAFVLCIIPFAVMGARGARAQTPPPCESDSNPNVVYVMAGDTQQRILQTLGKQLRQEPTNPLTVVFKIASSCADIDAMYNHTKLGAANAPAALAGPLNYIPADPSWDPNSTAPTCTVPDTGVDVDAASSAVFFDACTQTPTPADVKVHRGGVQSLVFVVPAASAQNLIHAEEAYFVFGYGARGQAQPWVNESVMYIRAKTKGSIISLGASINVPPAKWKGVPIDTSLNLLNKVADPANPDPQRTIGILGNEIADSNRDKVRTLAFQAYKQQHGYLPDSTSGATNIDKRNVRDGHYHAWTYTSWMQHVDGSGNPVKANAGRFIDAMVNNPVTTPFSFQPIDTQISTNLVPLCAMKVQRTAEGGDFTAYQPDAPCGCYFESKVGTPSASCKACTSDSTCSNGAKCRYGFCEAR